MTVTKRQLTRWTKMTDENEHTEVRIEIAQHYAKYSRISVVLRPIFAEFPATFENIRRRQEKQGCLSQNDAYMRDGVTDQLLDLIRNAFGEGEYKAVYNCL